MGRRGDLSIHGQLGEKGFDFRRAHLARMALVVIENKAPGPIDVGSLGAIGIVPESDRIATLSEQSLGSLRHANLRKSRFAQAAGL